LIIGVLSICCCSGIVAYKWRNASYLGSGKGIDSSSINQQSSPNVLPVVSSQSPTINQQQVPMATAVAVPIPIHCRFLSGSICATLCIMIHQRVQEGLVMA
jgi:hypothetical protein